MDFGFGAFLEKFEQHFGKLALRLLLLLIGLFVALFCAKGIWDIAIRPMVTAVSSARIAEDTSFALLMGGAFVFGFVITGMITARLTAWRVRALKEMMDKTEALNAEMQASFGADMGRVEELERRARAALEEAEALREKAIRRKAREDERDD